MTSFKPQINFLLGWPSPSLQPISALRAATTAALSNPSVYVPGLQYGPDGGYPPLRKEIAVWLQRFYPNCSTSANTIAISGGASQNLSRVLQGFTDPIYTRNVWMVAPTYYLACKIFEDAGFKGKLRAVEEDTEGLNIQKLRDGLIESESKAKAEGNVSPGKKGFTLIVEKQNIKPPRKENKIYKQIIYVVPTFANPSAKIMTFSRRRELVRLAREFDALLVTDDVYDFLQWSTTASLTFQASRAIEPRIVDVDRTLDGGTHRDGADQFGNVMSNGSFSKIVGPGVRCGWADSTEKFAFALSQIGSTKSGGAPSQLVATFITEMLKTGALERHIYDKLQPDYAARHRRLLTAIGENLTPLGVRVGATGREDVAGGYFTWLGLPVSVSAQEFAHRAKEDENVIIAPGSMFQVYGDEATAIFEHAIRLCYSYEDEDKLDEGIRRLANIIRDMRDEAE